MEFSNKLTGIFQRESQLLNQLSISFSVLEHRINDKGLFLLDITQQISVGTALHVEQLEEKRHD